MMLKKKNKTFYYYYIFKVQKHAHAIVAPNEIKMLHNSKSVMSEAPQLSEICVPQLSEMDIKLVQLWI